MSVCEKILTTFTSDPTSLSSFYNHRINSIFWVAFLKPVNEDRNIIRKS